jgi:hypothetical protein
MTGYLMRQGSQMICEKCDAHCLRKCCPAAEQHPNVTVGTMPKKLGKLWKEVFSEDKAKCEVSRSSQNHSCSHGIMARPGLEHADPCVDTFPCSPGESALCAGNGREGHRQGCSRAC